MLDVEIESIKVDRLSGICVIETSIQRSHTSPTSIIRTISTPEKVGKINSVLNTIQIVVPSGTTQRKQEFSIGVLLTVIHILLEVGTSFIQEIVGRVVDSVVSRSSVVSIPALISECLGYESVGLGWEDIDESDGNDVDVWLFTEVSQVLLVCTGALYTISTTPVSSN